MLVLAGTLPSADVEAKLKKLTAINFNSCNWIWVLNPNKPPILPSVQRVLASGKSQLAPDPRRLLRKRIVLTPRQGSLPKE